MQKKGKDQESSRGKVVLMKTRGRDRDRERQQRNMGRANEQQDPKHNPGTSEHTKLTLC